MALKLRLARHGAKKRPYYRIVVADSRMPRDGRYIERVGSYNPLLAKGARPTERVARFLGGVGLWDWKAGNNPEKGKPGQKALERVEEKKEKAEARKEAEEEAKREAAEAAKAAEEAAKAAEEEAKNAPKEDDVPMAETQNEAEAAMITRPDVVVELRQLPSGAVTFIETLREATLGEAAAAASGEEGFDLAANISGLFEAGAVRGIVAP